MTKQRRSSSKPRVPDPEDEPPMSESSDTPLTSNTPYTQSRFGELMKQALEDTTADAKARRRKKKSEEFMLEKLRTGETLRKDEDQTLVANTYDPDDVKGEKSNKRRQKSHQQNDEKENKKGHTNLSYEDETNSPEKKKKSITSEGKKLKKRTNIDTESEAEPKPESDGALPGPSADQPGLEHETPSKTRRKKKKIKEPLATAEQQRKEYEKPLDDIYQYKEVVLSDNPLEYTEVKKKKKKKVKSGPREVADPSVQADPTAGVSGSQVLADSSASAKRKRSVADEGRVIGIIVHRTDKLRLNYYISHPLVRVHIFDLDTGKHLKKQHRERAVTSYYEKDTDVDFILPIMTFPYDFKQNKSVLPMWEETLVFNENYNFILQDKPNVIILFELLDFISFRRARHRFNKDKQDGGWQRMAWAFLKVVGARGKPNTERKVRLQFYQVPLNPVLRDGHSEVYDWYKLGRAARMTYPSTLYVTVKGMIIPETLSPAPRSLFATQAEIGQMSYDEMQQTLDNGTRLDGGRQHNPSLWSRLQGQVCKVPNALHFTLPISRKGCFSISFSPDGRSLACACHDNDGYPIIIYNIPEGTMKGQILGHTGIIYDLHWSRDNNLLMSASSDGTARIWNGSQIIQMPIKLLPHPTYVYTARFHVRVQTVVVSGSYDRIIRIWTIQGNDMHAELLQELDGHRGFVNALCFDGEGAFLYSGDSEGRILVWNAYCTDQPSKKGVLKDWTKNGEIHETEMDGTPINSLVLHPNGRRLLIHCRDNVIRMLDIRIGAIMQRYHGALNFREQIRSTISPCGTFVFSGSEDSAAYVWNAEAGDRVASYKELGFNSPVTDVAFHPHDHMIAFCSYKENHPVLVYKYDHEVAQRDAGLQMSQKMAISQLWSGQQSPRDLLAESNESLVHKRSMQRRTEGMEISTMARLQKVQRKLESVTMMVNPNQAPDHPLGLPRALSPSVGTSLSRTYDTTFDYSAWYNQLPTDSCTMSNLAPGLLSPHAAHCSIQTTTTQQQQLAAETEYRRVGGNRPDFNALGTQGNLQQSVSPLFGERAPAMSVNTNSDRPRFSVTGKTTTAGQVVALYDYQAQRSDELTLVRKDVINVLYKDNNNWWMGELDNGQQGFFPANYVIGCTDSLDKRTSDAELLDEFRTPGSKSDMTDEEEMEEETHLKERMAAIISRSGELKIFSASATESDADRTTPKKARKKKKVSLSTTESNVSVVDEMASKRSTTRRKKKKASKVEESQA